MSHDGQAATVFTGAEILIKALIDQGVEVIFGYPGGAVLPIYDALFSRNDIRHVLVRHEQAAVHAAEGYARSTGRVGVVLVTSGPGATNAVTGIVDAMMDSIPLVVITGQVPTHLVGTDAFQECDTTGITRQCTKHNYMVKSVTDLSPVIYEAFHIARFGRPGPVVIDLPKDVQFATTEYIVPSKVSRRGFIERPTLDHDAVAEAIALLRSARKPIVYVGGGVVNSGPRAIELLREFLTMSKFPATTTLMALGAVEPDYAGNLRMLGMHGSYEANWAMHDCDVMLAVGARFDDRITGRVDAFSPNSKKIHIDIDASSINKIVHADIAIWADCADALTAINDGWRKLGHYNHAPLNDWYQQITEWRAKNSFSYALRDSEITPQHAIRRFGELTKGRDRRVTTEVGLHQMWAAQFLEFDDPRRWGTSGGLGTMGYGLPSAIGMQIAHPDALVVDIAGEASILMNIQELSTIVQHNLPVKIFIINNEYMGMVRQWQELLHGGRLSESYVSSLPDFVKLAQSYGIHGIRAVKPEELDRKLIEMIDHPGPVIFDCVVARDENCFPMILSGKAHNEMILYDDRAANSSVDAHGMKMV